jgi:hypothetical protein
MHLPTAREFMQHAAGPDIGREIGVGMERAGNGAVLSRWLRSRLQVKSVEQYVELINNLNRPKLKMMDVAVPANMRVCFAQEEIAQRGCAVSAADALSLNGRSDVAFVDLRARIEPFPSRWPLSVPAPGQPPQWS